MPQQHLLNCNLYCFLTFPNRKKNNYIIQLTPTNIIIQHLRRLLALASAIIH